MKKKIISSIMCLAMLLSLLPASAFAIDSGSTYTATFAVKDSEGTVINNPTIVVSYTEGEEPNVETKTVQAESDGSYTLTAGTDYSYTVTAEGYQKAEGTITEPTGTDASVEVEVTMEAVQEVQTYKAAFAVKDSEGTAISNPTIVVSYTEGEEPNVETKTYPARSRPACGTSA